MTDAAFVLFKEAMDRYYREIQKPATTPYQHRGCAAVWDAALDAAASAIECRLTCGSHADHRRTRILRDAVLALKHDKPIKPKDGAR